jgi:serine/threonine protein kinase
MNGDGGAAAVAAGAARSRVRVGRYQVLHPLGMGGMAEVLKARATGPGGFERTVVIKRILRDHSGEEEFLRMFTDEAKIMGMLHHPNVVQVYDFGADADGSLFLALEYVDGPAVSRILRMLRTAGRPMPVAVAAYIAREVCRALDYVHNLTGPDGKPLSVIHRDVTPSNIMFTSTGGVKLLDFGVAKYAAARQATKDGTVKGKPAYLAPEQLEGKPFDGRVDVFALGVVLHEMLSLEHLFAGDSDLATMKKILEREIPIPSQTRRDVPPELDRIVMRALERDPVRRTSSAGVMARALDDFILGCRLRLEDVVTFLRGVDREMMRPRHSPWAVPGQAGWPAPALADRAATRWDLGLWLRMHNPMGQILASPRWRVGAVVAAMLATMGAAAWSFARSGPVTTTADVAAPAEDMTAVRGAAISSPVPDGARELAVPPPWPSFDDKK